MSPNPKTPRLKAAHWSAEPVTTIYPLSNPAEVVVGYDSVTGLFVISVNGAAYTPFSLGGAAMQPFQDAGGGNIREVLLTNRLALGAAATATANEKLFIQASADPAPGDASVRVRASVAQTGDVERVETSAGALLRSTTINGDVLAGRDVTATRNVSGVQGFFQNATPLATLGTEALESTRVFVGAAGLTQGTYFELRQTSGASAGSFGLIGFTLTQGNSSETSATYCAQFNGYHGGTGANRAIYALSATFGADPTAAANVGLVTDAWGVKSNFSAQTSAPGVTSAYTRMTHFFADLPNGVDATHTVGTSYGFWCKNQGATGVTTALGIDIEKQSGASAFNIGIRNAGSTVYPSTTPTALSVNPTNNLANPDCTWLRLSATGNLDLTGIVAGFDGQMLIIANVGGANTITLKNQSGSSTAGNKFQLSGGADKALAPDTCITLIYDGTSTEWRQFSPLT